MCGIYGFHHINPLKVSDLVSVLLTGLSRMEYRGYDSAGVCVEVEGKYKVIKSVGKVDSLRKECIEMGVLSEKSTKLEKSDGSITTSSAIAHTRWATHGPPCVKNSHPVSFPDLSEEEKKSFGGNEKLSENFTVVHNGIIANHSEIRTELAQNYKTETDTEVIVGLAYYVYWRYLEIFNQKDSKEKVKEKSLDDCTPHLPLSTLATICSLILKGQFAFVLVSSHHGSGMVGVRNCSPLVLGVLADKKNARKEVEELKVKRTQLKSVTGTIKEQVDKLILQVIEIEENSPVQSNKNIEEKRNKNVEEKSNESVENFSSYFLASDTAAVVEHTDRIIYLQDGDVVDIDGSVKITNYYQEGEVQENLEYSEISSSSRKITRCTTKLEDIQKGEFKHFMLKEIHEQSRTVQEAMRERIFIENVEQKVKESRGKFCKEELESEMSELSGNKQKELKINEEIAQKNLIIESVPGGNISSASLSSNSPQDASNTVFPDLTHKINGNLTYERSQNSCSVVFPELASLDFSNLSQITLIACGTSRHAALAVLALFELTGCSVQVEIASDYVDRVADQIELTQDNGNSEENIANKISEKQSERENEPTSPSHLFIFISQSGETADLLTALRYVQRRHLSSSDSTHDLSRNAQTSSGKIHTLSITNTPGSTLSRSTDSHIYLRCGKEIGVASTKAFTSQYVVLVLVACFVVQQKINSKSLKNQESSALDQYVQSILIELVGIHEKVQNCLELSPQIVKIAENLLGDSAVNKNQKRKKSALVKSEKNSSHSNNNSLIVLGRGTQFSISLEIALKIKELSYLHAEGIPSGELKHGPLALIDSDSKIVMIMLSDGVKEKSLNCLEEIRARGGKPILIMNEELYEENYSGKNGEIANSSEEIVVIPNTHPALYGLLTVIPAQLLSYYLADKKGCDVDCPRNLAKSVTVE